MILCIIGYTNAGTYQSYKSYYNVVDSLVVKDITGNAYLYVTASVSDNKIKYDLLTSSEPLKIIDGKYEFMEYHWANYFFWSLFGVTLHLLVISYLLGLGDDSVSWGWKESWKNAFFTLITCEEENGKFYYMCLGRLLTVKDQPMQLRHGIYYDLGINDFKDLHLYPKFQTKQSRRQSKLDKLGIS